MAHSDTDPAGAWADLVEGLRAAGEQLDAATADLDPLERADAYRALLRALNNHLGRFETDRELPELVPFNEWRQKLLMDNPDFRYWVADLRAGRRYRIRGSMGDAVFLSITAYESSGTLEAGAASRLDSDAIAFDDDGGFEVVLSPVDPGDGSTWIELPERASSVWVRQFHDDVANDRLGTCSIEPLDTVDPVPLIDPGRFAHQLRRLGSTMDAMPRLFAGSVKPDLTMPNEIRHWTAMTNGAAFTEPGIHYLRGAWQLEDDEALVIDGSAPNCRYWSALLYSRFCNSLDHRRRRVSVTGATADTSPDGGFRLVLSGRDPGPGHDWLDTEGRRFGLFVFRFLLPETEPTLPTLRVVPLAELAGLP